MDESQTPKEVSGADQFDPLHRRRRFSWRVFLVAAVTIVGTLVLRQNFSDIGFGIATAVCAIVAIAIAAPSAYSESWLSETMPEVAKALNTESDASGASEDPSQKSNESDAV
jgi:hypothetical protein